jgi:hypothetical protein
MGFRRQLELRHIRSGGTRALVQSLDVVDVHVD